MRKGQMEDLISEKRHGRCIEKTSWRRLYRSPECSPTLHPFMTQGLSETEGMPLYSVAEDWFFFYGSAQKHFESMQNFHSHNILHDFHKETCHFAWCEWETCFHLLLPRFCIGRDNEQLLSAHLFSYHLEIQSYLSFIKIIFHPN